MKKLVSTILIACALIGLWFVITEIYTAKAQVAEVIKFEVKKDESVAELAKRLDSEQVIRHAWLFKKYLVFKGVDTQVRAGEFEVTAPITLARVVDALSQTSFSEITITIIPGWNIGDIATYLEKEGIASAKDFTDLVGLPAVNYQNSSYSLPNYQPGEWAVLQDRPQYVSFEGYLAPDTYRIYKDASLKEIVDKLVAHRDSQFSEQMYADIKKADRTVHEVMTVASIVEREVRSEEDKKLVADLFWRRYDLNWALQADSTVHYAVGKSGNVFTTAEDRDSLSAWNTYRYPGLPPSPISSPSLKSIMATIYPTENDYWYFLTDSEGKVYYAKTLNEHNENRAKYLK